MGQSKNSKSTAMHPGYTARRLSLDLLARDKSRVYELQDNGEYAGDRAKPLDVGVIEGMVAGSGCIVKPNV